MKTQFFSRLLQRVEDLSTLSGNSLMIRGLRFLDLMSWLAWGLDILGIYSRSPREHLLGKWCVLRIAQIFPGFVNANYNQQLMAKVTNDELLKILHTFQKDKSPG